MIKIDEALDQKIRSVTGLARRNEIVDDDVFIIGHPKSGHTWFQNLVAGVIYGIDLDYTPYSVVWELVPEHNWPYFKRYSTPMFFKTHDLPKPKYRRVVYMLRDGRDVMVSYYHYLKVTRKQEEKKTDFLKVVQGQQGIYPFKKWHEHVELWLANPYQAQLLVIKYEDLLQNTVEELQRFCEFMKVKRDRAGLAQVAEKASFRKMREKERRHGLEKPEWQRPDWPNWPKEKRFMRRGEMGSYKDEMPAEVLEAFLRDAGETLRKFGYL
jgi:hypothetical protein